METNRHTPTALPESRLGIDIGRVIIDGSSHPDGDDTAFFKGGVENALRTPAMPGALDAIAELTRSFDGRVWLVSKCGERVADRSRAWLAHHRFFERTGIDPEHLRFCRQRPEKAIHCAELAITHFVDDRSDVLDALDGVVPHRYLFGPQKAGTARRPGVVPVLTWAVAEDAIARDLLASA